MTETDEPNRECYYCGELVDALVCPDCGWTTRSKKSPVEE